MVGGKNDIITAHLKQHLSVKQETGRVTGCLGGCEVLRLERAQQHAHTGSRRFISGMRRKT